MLTKTWAGYDQEPIFYFPNGRFHPFHWIDECLFQTTAVASFREVIVQKGATSTEARVVSLVVQRGSFASCMNAQGSEAKLQASDGDYHNDSLSYGSVRSGEKDSAIFTAAWKKEFPDYIVGGLPREIHRMLDLINARIDAPGTVGIRGSMPVALVAKGLLSMLATGLVPTTGVRLDGHKLEPMEEAIARVLGGLEVCRDLATGWMKSEDLLD